MPRAQGITHGRLPAYTCRSCVHAIEEKLGLGLPVGVSGGDGVRTVQPVIDTLCLTSMILCNRPLSHNHD